MKEEREREKGGEKAGEELNWWNAWRKLSGQCMAESIPSFKAHPTRLTTQVHPLYSTMIRIT